VIVNLLSSAVALALIAGLLFGTAGRADLPFFWAYLGVLAAGCVASSVLADPTLTRERLRPGPGAKFYATDPLMPILMLGQYIVAGLDVGRFHWSDTVPFAAQVTALAVVAVGLALNIWAVAVNRFFSTAVRIQTDRGHTVITTGPYRFIRHPGYAAFLVYLAAGGPALGSWLAGLVGLLVVFPILRRLVDEDRVLRERLDGYSDYAQRVRYRLLPGV
jgi:protein-S-isoprenylcysteine O-methyltransferase Ste14